MRLLGPFRRQVVTNLQVLQTQVGYILQVTGVSIGVTTVERTIVTGVTRHVSIRVLRCPIVIYVPSRHLVIRTVVLSPEYGGLVRRIPILLTHTLEEGVEPDVIPVTGEREAVDIARLLVTDNLAVTRIIHRVLATVDVAITIQVLKLDVTRIELVGL